MNLSALFSSVLCLISSCVLNNVGVISFSGVHLFRLLVYCVFQFYSQVSGYMVLILA
jgi:hypothetical protein